MSVITLDGLYRLLYKWIDKHYNEELQTEEVSQDGIDNWTCQQVSTNQLALTDVVDQVFLIPASMHRCVTSQGVKINYLYYWNPIFDKLNLQGQRVLVKYDLENLGSAWVYVDEQWIECFSKYHSRFRRLSKSQAQELSIEIHKNHFQRSKKVTKVPPIFDEALQGEILRSLSWKDQGHKNINNQRMSNDRGDCYDAPD